AHGRYEGEGWRQRKDGSRFYAAVSLSALRDEQGTLLGFVKVTQDITERKRTAERQRFLAEAGTVLAVSLDYRSALVGLAQLAVPLMADWCTIDLRNEGGVVERIATAHVNAGMLRIASELHERYPATDGEAVMRILASGKSE